ncbi:MAG: hypothetical protein Q7J10_08945 [Methanosarcinaceae archaeon]|nr:hypothetical protein [Methanosarcinaceae archaeon]
MTELYLILFCMAYLLYVSWSDIKTRTSATSIHILVLAVLVLTTSFKLSTAGDVNLVEYGLKGCFLGILFTLLTIGVIEQSFNRETFLFTFPIFAMLSYLYIALSESHSMQIVLALLIPGILLWDLASTRRLSLMQKIPLGGVVWSVAYMAMIVFLFSVLSNEMVGINTRAIIVFNFIVPIGMQLRTNGFGNGDVLILWIITAFMMLIGKDITAGYGVLLYAGILYIFFSIGRVAIHMRSNDTEIYKVFMNLSITTLLSITVLAMILYQLVTRSTAFLVNTTSGILFFVSIFVVMIVPVMLAQKLLNKYLDKKKDAWDRVQEYVDKVPRLKKEPFAVEMTCGFILTILLGTPASIILRYIVIPMPF